MREIPAQVVRLVYLCSPRECDAVDAQGGYEVGSARKSQGGRAQNLH